MKFPIKQRDEKGGNYRRILQTLEEFYEQIR